MRTPEDKRGIEQAFCGLVEETLRNDKVDHIYGQIFLPLTV